MARNDPHSYTDSDHPRTHHIRWRGRVDFDTRVIDANIVLCLAEPSGSGPIDLDTRDLEIAAVRDAAGNELPFHLGDADPVLGSRLRIDLPAGSTELHIDYRTAPEASALQWLTPEQTAGGRHPFLFSQCQPIHARSVIPVQDTPAHRITFDAEIDVPAPLRGLVAARFVTREPRGERSVERWHMPQRIPPYLFAFAVGNLERRDVGGRSAVWSEPEVIEQAAWEFDEIDQLIDAGERLFGPYDWERFDMLVMPPSFPYGGMENPRLTFLTPTLLTGDRSQVCVVAHELAHSWTGNLITNANAEHFWLNEGWTRYAEQRIVEEVYGRELSELQIELGHQALERTVARFEERGRPELTRLKTELAGVHPDDAFSEVPYEKGLLFLRALELEVGRERFDRFIKTYISTFAFQSLDTVKFTEFVDRELPGSLAAIRADDWIYRPGIPTNVPRIDSPRLDAVRKLGAAVPDRATADSLQPIEWQLYLEAVKEPTLEWCRSLDERYQLTANRNFEVLTSWLVVGIAAGYPPALERAAEALGETGRMKFLKPLYEALNSQPEYRSRARELFDRYRASYHPIAQAAIGDNLT